MRLGGSACTGCPSARGRPASSCWPATSCTAVLAHRIPVSPRISPYAPYAPGWRPHLTAVSRCLAPWLDAVVGQTGPTSQWASWTERRLGRTSCAGSHWPVAFFFPGVESGHRRQPPDTDRRRRMGEERPARARHCAVGNPRPQNQKPHVSERSDKSQRLQFHKTTKPQKATLTGALPSSDFVAARRALAPVLSLSAWPLSPAWSCVAISPAPLPVGVARRLVRNTRAAATASLCLAPSPTTDLAAPSPRPAW